MSSDDDFNPAIAIDDCFYFCDKLFDYHGIKIYEFGDVHKEILDRIIRSRWSLTIIPVSHLKTTLVSKGYALWRMWKEHNYQIALVSSSRHQTETIMEENRYLIENTPWLSHLAANKNESGWSKSTLLMPNRNKLFLAPFNSSSRGIQPNEIIYDDLLRDEEGVTDLSMDDIKKTFRGVFFNRGAAKFCKHHVVGTPQSSDDLYTEIEATSVKLKRDWDIDWSIMRYGAINVKKGGDPLNSNDWESPLWKERYTLKELGMIRDVIGQYTFNKEFMCRPALTGASFFPNILMATDDLLCFNYKTSGRITVGFDYATSTSPTADFNSAVVVEEFLGLYKKKLIDNTVEKEFIVNNPVFIKKIYHFKGEAEQLSVARDIRDRFPGDIKFICDASGPGKNSIKKLIADGFFVESQDFQSDNRTKLLINLRALFELDHDIENCAPRLVIPTAEVGDTFEKTGKLIRELTNFQEGKTKMKRDTILSLGKHDDIAIALAMAVKDIHQTGKSTAPVIMTASKYESKINRPKPVHDDSGNVLVVPGHVPSSKRFKLKTW